MSFIEKLKQGTNQLHWTEKACFFNLAMMLFFIPIYSGSSVIFAGLWCFSVVLKNSLLKRWSFFSWHQDKAYTPHKSIRLMIPMACYWLICLFSMLWTENKAEGWQEVNRITWFLVFPLVYAITDFRELKHIHLRAQGGLSVADGCRCLTKELDMIAC